MKKIVIVRNVTFGEGMPAICVPIMGKTRGEIREEARAFTAHRAEIAEWRVDAYLAAEAKEKGMTGGRLPLIPVLQMLRRELHSTPLLMTIRTKEEGGLLDISQEDYLGYLRDALYSGCVDMLDLEWRFGKTICDELIREAHEEDVKVIVSSHDFAKTPSEEEMIERLTQMEEFGADLPKLAVMPQNAQDVISLCEATVKASQKLTQPIITMSMGSLGAVSRITGETFGSAMTFASAGEASAPGQMSISGVRETLQLLHKAK